MKKIIIWISAIPRYLFLDNYPANSTTYKATKLSKREPAPANAIPKNACMGMSCQQHCKRKATPACNKGRATIDLLNAFNQGPAGLKQPNV